MLYVKHVTWAGDKFQHARLRLFTATTAVKPSHPPAPRGGHSPRELKHLGSFPGAGITIPPTTVPTHRALARLPRHWLSRVVTLTDAPHLGWAVTPWSVCHRCGHRSQPGGCGASALPCNIRKAAEVEEGSPASEDGTALPPSAGTANRH